MLLLEEGGEKLLKLWFFELNRSSLKPELNSSKGLPELVSYFFGYDFSSYYLLYSAKGSKDGSCFGAGFASGSGWLKLAKGSSGLLLGIYSEGSEGAESSVINVGGLYYRVGLDYGGGGEGLLGGELCSGSEDGPNKEPMPFFSALLPPDLFLPILLNSIKLTD